MNDRELLAEIGLRAVREHEAWAARNSARSSYRKWLKNYQDETGEWYDREACQHGGELEDIAAHDVLKKASTDAQRQLASARAATRRAIVRAATEQHKYLIFRESRDMPITNRRPYETMRLAKG